MYHPHTTQRSSESTPNDNRPSLVEIVAQSGVYLRRTGRELLGLCPLHPEKTPSFSVNPDKQVWHCHGCQAGGDVFSFIMELKGLTFVEAKSYLRVDGPRRFLKPVKSPEQIAAKALVAWAKKTSLTLSFRMRLLARGMTDEEEADELCSRQWHILEALDDDLANAALLPGLWKQRDVVEGIVNGC